MTWLRVRLTGEQQRVVNEDGPSSQRASPEKSSALVIAQRVKLQDVAKIVGVSRATVQRYVAAFERRWRACDDGTSIAGERDGRLSRLIRESFEKQPSAPWPRPATHSTDGLRRGRARS